MHRMRLDIVFKFHEYNQDEAGTLQWRHNDRGGV